MQRIWYDCWSSTTSTFSDSKVHIRQRGKDFGCFNIKHYRESLLVQVATEIPCQVTVEMSLIFRNGQLTSWLFNWASRSCVQWTNATHHPWFFFGWRNWGWMCIKWDLQSEFTKSWRKKKQTKETRSYDIRDMFPGQNETDSKRLRAADKDPKTIVIDDWNRIEFWIQCLLMFCFGRNWHFSFDQLQG